MRRDAPGRARPADRPGCTSGGHNLWALAVSGGLLAPMAGWHAQRAAPQAPAVAPATRDCAKLVFSALRSRPLSRPQLAKPGNLAQSQADNTACTCGPQATPPDGRAPSQAAAGREGRGGARPACQLHAPGMVRCSGLLRSLIPANCQQIAGKKASAGRKESPPKGGLSSYLDTLGVSPMRISWVVCPTNPHKYRVFVGFHPLDLRGKKGLEKGDGPCYNGVATQPLYTSHPRGPLCSPN